jgi:Mce-associated membrane protein
MPDDAAISGKEPVVVADDMLVKRPIEVERLALITGLVAGMVLAGLVGWLGFRAYEAHKIEAQRTLFVQTARQEAVNISTVDYQHADADAQRVLDLATGRLYDKFSRRKQSYIDTAKQMRSKTVGTVTDAGLESQSGDVGRVLVAVTVSSSDPTHARREPQYARMRITVRKVGDVAKVTDVVPVS